MLTRTAWPEPPVTLNTLSAGWRVALAAAHEALVASTHCPTEILPGADLHARTSRLSREREQVAALLEADARVEHVRLARSLALPTVRKSDLGLPAAIDACAFDLDGVLAASAELHFAAWADTFDDFLYRRLDREHFSHFARFSRRADYVEFIHGRPRVDGVRAFLASRGITLPEGTPDDPPGAETVHGLANRKNEALQHRLAHEGVGAFSGSERYLEAAAAAGLATIVVSASANTAAILDHAGLTDLVDFQIDGDDMRRHALLPKPAPDTLVAACRLLGEPPAHVASFETTEAGVVAARAARVGLVVGVNRPDDFHGSLHADLTVGDLADLLDVRLTR